MIVLDVHRAVRVLDAADGLHAGEVEHVERPRQSVMHGDGVGHHPDRHRRVLAHLEQVVELVAQALGATDRPAQGVLVDHHLQSQRGGIVKQALLADLAELDDPVVVQWRYLVGADQRCRVGGHLEHARYDGGDVHELGGGEALQPKKSLSWSAITGFHGAHHTRRVGRSSSAASRSASSVGRP
jgi:hypothetical protein